MEVGVEHADGRRWLLTLVEERLGDFHRLVAHVALDIAALPVDAVEGAGQFIGTARIVGEQALDAQGHVGQATRGVDAWPQRETEVAAAGDLGLAAGGTKKRSQASGQAAGADAAQALGHQAAVVGVQAHHVGDGAQRHQRQERIEPRLLGRVESPTGAQLRAQRQQHIEHHAYACDRFARELAAGLVGVHDHRRVGQLRAWQVVVGHQHLQAQGVGGGHAFDAGDAVVHRDHQVRAPRLHALGDGRGEAVAVYHPVGHQVLDMRRAQHAQAAHRHCAGGRAVTVVVGHDAQTPLGGDGVGQQPGGVLRALHLLGGNQPGEALVEVALVLHAAGGEEARQQRVDAGLLQGPGGARRNVAGDEFHKVSRTWAGRGLRQRALAREIAREIARGRLCPPPERGPKAAAARSPAKVR